MQETPAFDSWVREIHWRRDRLPTPVFLGFPGKESTCSVGDPGSIPGLGRSAGEGIGYPLQYSWASLVAQLVRIRLQCRRPGFDPWVGKICSRRERLPTPIFLGFPCGSAGKGSAHNAKTWVQFLGWENLLEMGKATHSSILA